MQRVSIALGKTVFALLRLLGRTGSALPGLLIEKLNRGFLYHQLSQLPEGVIIISGTNGKTTTTKLTASLLESQGLRVLTNPTGSNFVRGIISVVIDKTGWNGVLPYDIAVFEQDEAHAVKLAERVHPRGVMVLNIMRDQMDRFGEIDTTRQMLQKLVAVAQEWVVLNANDERVSKLQPAKGVKTVWYAHSKSLQADFLTDDQLYHAESTVYHLAGKPLVELTAYTPQRVSFRQDRKLHDYTFALQGGHNALNLAAALSAVRTALPSVDEKLLRAAIGGVKPAFGRGEIITLPSGGLLTLQLIKNPGGFTQALRMLKLKIYDTVAIAINDDYPDGRDVSWLWDVDFHPIGDAAVYCGGVRAADMANRLKYDDGNSALVEPRIERYAQELDMAIPAGQEGILFCTYTAMLKLRGIYLGSISGLEEES